MCAIGRASRNDQARRTEREARTVREAIERAATLRASSRPVLGPDQTLELEAGGRRLLVHYGSGYRHAQVFAPPGGEFVGLEPMAAPANALGAGACPLVEPGGTFTARFALRVEEA